MPLLTRVVEHHRVSAHLHQRTAFVGRVARPRVHDALRQVLRRRELGLQHDCPVSDCEHLAVPRSLPHQFRLGQLPSSRETEPHVLYGFWELHIYRVRHPNIFLFEIQKLVWMASELLLNILKLCRFLIKKWSPLLYFSWHIS